MAAHWPTDREIMNPDGAIFQKIMAKLFTTGEADNHYGAHLIMAQLQDQAWVN
jgi:hypothetical protein